eukprot:CAMPEP_0206044160 /NCGR_PEP_ID=MMETSP1466-20131121/11747_1 /ASSEMBLY_ACC=CAM_ASM_001126 /TAXON_ID=44452 /ORGANISM="Pavlova gyrans, Strain CCMP608" /LENGTH=122 /DNA_ID=CAMNT_0053419043 /DNA_START=477 /DNA_END=841 /DNA_ORIENTATION=-
MTRAERERGRSLPPTPDALVADSPSWASLAREWARAMPGADGRRGTIRLDPGAERVDTSWSAAAWPERLSARARLMHAGDELRGTGERDAADPDDGEVGGWAEVVEKRMSDLRTRCIAPAVP